MSKIDHIADRTTRLHLHGLRVPDMRQDDGNDRVVLGELAGQRSTLPVDPNIQIALGIGAGPQSLNYEVMDEQAEVIRQLSPILKASPHPHHILFDDPANPEFWWREANPEFALATDVSVLGMPFDTSVSIFSRALRQELRVKGTLACRARIEDRVDGASTPVANKKLMLRIRFHGRRILKSMESEPTDLHPTVLELMGGVEEDRLLLDEALASGAFPPAGAELLIEFLADDKHPAKTSKFRVFRTNFSRLARPSTKAIGFTEYAAETDSSAESHRVLLTLFQRAAITNRGGYWLQLLDGEIPADMTDKVELHLWVVWPASDEATLNIPPFVNALALPATAGAGKTDRLLILTERSVSPDVWIPVRRAYSYLQPGCLPISASTKCSSAIPIDATNAIIAQTEDADLRRLLGDRFIKAMWSYQMLSYQVRPVDGGHMQNLPSFQTCLPLSPANEEPIGAQEAEPTTLDEAIRKSWRFRHTIPLGGGPYDHIGTSFEVKTRWRSIRGDQWKTNEDGQTQIQIGYVDDLIPLTAIPGVGLSLKSEESADEIRVSIIAEFDAPKPGAQQDEAQPLRAALIRALNQSQDRNVGIEARLALFGESDPPSGTPWLAMTEETRIKWNGNLEKLSSSQAGDSLTLFAGLSLVRPVGADAGQPMKLQIQIRQTRPRALVAPLPSLWAHLPHPAIEVATAIHWTKESLDALEPLVGKILASTLATHVNATGDNELWVVPYEMLQWKVDAPPLQYGLTPLSTDLFSGDVVIEKPDKTKDKRKLADEDIDVLARRLLALMDDVALAPQLLASGNSKIEQLESLLKRCDKLAEELNSHSLREFYTGQFADAKNPDGATRRRVRDAIQRRLSDFYALDVAITWPRASLKAGCRATFIGELLPSENSPVGIGSFRDVLVRFFQPDADKAPSGDCCILFDSNVSASKSLDLGNRDLRITQIQLHKDDDDLDFPQGPWLALRKPATAIKSLALGSVPVIKRVYPPAPIMPTPTFKSTVVLAGAQKIPDMSWTPVIPLPNSAEFESTDRLRIRSEYLNAVENDFGTKSFPGGIPMFVGAAYSIIEGLPQSGPADLVGFLDDQVSRLVDALAQEKDGGIPTGQSIDSFALDIKAGQWDMVTAEEAKPIIADFKKTRAGNPEISVGAVELPSLNILFADRFFSEASLTRNEVSGVKKLHESFVYERPWARFGEAIIASVQSDDEWRFSVNKWDQSEIAGVFNRVEKELIDKSKDYPVFLDVEISGRSIISGQTPDFLRMVAVAKDSQVSLAKQCLASLAQTVWKQISGRADLNNGFFLVMNLKGRLSDADSHFAFHLSNLTIKLN